MFFLIYTASGAAYNENWSGLVRPFAHWRACQATELLEDGHQYPRTDAEEDAGCQPLAGGVLQPRNARAGRRFGPSRRQKQRSKMCSVNGSRPVGRLLSWNSSRAVFVRRLVCGEHGTNSGATLSRWNAQVSNCYSCYRGRESSGLFSRRNAKKQAKGASNARQKPGHQRGTPGLPMKK